MTAKLITMWLMANGSMATQAIPMLTMDACFQAAEILIEHTRPIVHENGFLKQAQFECQET